MSFQDQIWITTLVGISAVVLAFLFLISRSGQKEDPAAVQTKAFAIRKWFFGALIVFGIIVAGVSLRPFPIAPQHGPAQTPQVIHVVGTQWAWKMDPGPIHVGTPVAFEVTSADVNHGFGIYNDTKRMLAQTQSMPGVTNRLVYTFEQPGKYELLCLEYCGLGHHAMVLTFDVVAAEANQ